MEGTSTPNYNSESENVLEFFEWMSGEFFDQLGIAPSNDSVLKMKKLAREVALND